MYAKESRQIKLISVPCLQCSVFIGVCALIDSELVIPCHVNRGCELWSGAPGCWPTLDQTCIAANACADFEWVIFPDTVCSVCWADLVARAGLLVCGFTSLRLVGFCDSYCLCYFAMRRPLLSAPHVLWFIRPYLWFTVKVWCEPTSLVWAFNKPEPLRTEIPAPWFRKS